MKKFLAIATLCFSTASAFAVGPTVGLGYDLDVARNNSRNFDTAQEVRLSVAQPTKFGTVDAALLGARFRGVGADDANGFELGYKNGFAYKGIGVFGRAAYGRLNQIDPNGGGFTGNSGYLSLGAEGQLPLDSRTNVFAGYRHRNSFGSDMYTQNRYSVGLDYAVTSSVEVRVGYAHTRQAGLKFNGVTANISYSF